MKCNRREPLKNHFKTCDLWLVTWDLRGIHKHEFSKLNFGDRKCDRIFDGKWIQWKILKTLSKTTELLLLNSERQFKDWQNGWNWRVKNKQMIKNSWMRKKMKMDSEIWGIIEISNPMMIWTIYTCIETKQKR